MALRAAAGQLGSAAVSSDSWSSCPEAHGTDEQTDRQTAVERRENLETHTDNGSYNGQGVSLTSRLSVHLCVFVPVSMCV